MMAPIHHPGVVLATAARAWSGAELGAEVADLANRLRAEGVRCLATLLDNGAAWAVADLASWQAGVLHLPLPGFFTPQQIDHAVQAAGADAVLCEPQALGLFAGSFGGDLGGNRGARTVVAAEPLCWLRRAAKAPAVPAGTVKLSFTSGSTGTPKGVCLGGQAMLAVADGIVAATAPLRITHHLCALPLPVLLENIAGLLAPLRRGARITLLPLQQLGLYGATSFDPARLHAAVEAHAPHSLILLPQMLRSWTTWLARSGLGAPASLRLVAVGGAAVGERLIAAARSVGIPACEGYGLTEGASVQTLDLPGDEQPGSVGRALPHARLRVAADGEIEVAGSLFGGYLGDPHPVPEWWPTGDLGELDASGRLWVRGRKKQVLITAYGRNVSPEWVETSLRGEAAVAQAVVFGDGEPALSAVLWPAAEALPPAQIDAALGAAVAAANAGLPDYARIGSWVRARADFCAATGMATANGRPRREAILKLHADALHSPRSHPETATGEQR